MRQGGETGWVHIALVRPLVAPSTTTPAGSPPVAVTPVEQPPTDPASGFRTASDIDKWFVARTGSGFIEWFQRDHQERGAWADRVIAGRRAAEGFSRLFDRIELVFDRPAISLEQFLGLISVVIYETGGQIWPISELVGMSGHPGIAYAFDRIDGLKASYNTGANRTAGSLFRDPAFIAAFGRLPNASDVLHTADPRWDGEVFPQEFPSDPEAESAIKECDFYKFRGRGFIQTTWRSAYKEILNFIQGADDPDLVIQKYRAAWANLDAETAATVSTNAQWDELFQGTDCIVACAGIRIHNKGKGDYLGLSSDRAVLAGSDAGSAFHCGRMVNGGIGYANQMRERVLQLRDSLLS